MWTDRQADSSIPPETFIYGAGLSPEIFEGVLALCGIVKLGRSSITNVTQTAYEHHIF